jgi:hypothetical protein
MIRIEGVPIVAARLAAMQKSTKALKPTRPASAHRTQERRFPVASKTVRPSQRRAIAQERA